MLGVTLLTHDIAISIVIAAIAFPAIRILIKNYRNRNWQPTTYAPQHPYPQLSPEQEEEQERKMQGYFSELEEGNILIIVSEN